MAMRSGEIAVTGSVAVTAKLNVRQSAPSRLSPVLRKQDTGTQLNVAAITAGDEVQGNRLWFQLTDGSFVWSGACGPLQQLVQTASAAIAPVVPVVPAAASEFPPAKVIDLYHYDGVTSFDEARVSGVLGVIHKASTGQSGRDDQYSARRDAANHAGLLWGAYHWGTAAPAAAQVENFLEAAKPDDKTLVALDFEDTPGNQMTLAGAREFLELIEQRLGRKAVIYSANTIKNALGTRRDEFFGSHRLWLAQYGTSPTVQASWDSYWLWQFTEGKASDPRRRRIPGIAGNPAGEVDCNYYPFTPEQLESEWAS
jgi:GH25 family lysozyme M1 (1,4-beta-N-acetylmuramidase)